MTRAGLQAVTDAPLLRARRHVCQGQGGAGGGDMQMQREQQQVLGEMWHAAVHTPCIGRVCVHGGGVAEGARVRVGDI